MYNEFVIAGPPSDPAGIGGVGSASEALSKIAASIDAGEFDWDASKEDVHMNIESALTEAIGEAGGRLHTGRSRNDQVATDMRLWTRDACASVVKDIDALLEVLADGVLHEGARGRSGQGGGPEGQRGQEHLGRGAGGTEPVSGEIGEGEQDEGSESVSEHRVAAGGALEGRLQLQLVFEYPRRCFHHPVFLGHGRNLDNAAAQVAAQ